jgi:hypothetical protein
MKMGNSKEKKLKKGDRQRQRKRESESEKCEDEKVVEPSSFFSIYKEL